MPRAVALVPLALLVLPTRLAAQTGDGRTPVSATARRTATPPTVDGRLDDPAWQTAEALSGFRQREPREGEPATERTEVRILFDADALYLGVWLYDSDPSGIVHGETRRDARLDDTDAFLILLDTYRDRQNAFVFGTNPAGIEYDGQVTREGTGSPGALQRQQTGSGGGFNLNWDGSWRVATSIDARGWYAEFRIPFSTLRYGRGGRQTWGLNFARHIRRRNEQAYWSPVPRQYSLYRVSEAGALEGIELPARRTATITPYVRASTARDSAPSGGIGPARDEVELGGDAKLSVTPSLALDLTGNTDFAQVEVDEQQVNLSRFSLFFPEKRPFFLENAGVFAVGTPETVDLFFSRRIGIDPSGAPVPIAGGGRLTGKAAGLLVGFLDIQTEGVGGGPPAINYAVARVLRELPNRSRLGAMVVNRGTTEGRDSSNQTYVLDGRLGLGEAAALDAYAADTRTPGLNGRDHAVALSGSYTTRDWELEGGYREVGEDFNPEVGFLERAGYRFVHARWLRHVRFAGVPWLRELRPHMSYRGFFDFSGFNETALLHFDSHVAFANGAFFSPAINWTREGLKQPFEIRPGVIVPPGTYDNLEAGWRFYTNESAPVSFNGGLDVGGFLSGHRRGGFGTLTARGGATLLAALRVSYSRVELPEGRFEATLLGLRVGYAFTPRLYLQSLVQYSNQTETWSGNVRFGWLNTAGTGLFLVYNRAERTGALAAPLSRAFIVKFTRQLSLAG